MATMMGMMTGTTMTMDHGARGSGSGIAPDWQRRAGTERTICKKTGRTHGPLTNGETFP